MGGAGIELVQPRARAARPARPRTPRSAASNASRMRSEPNSISMIRSPFISSSIERDIAESARTRRMRRSEPLQNRRADCNIVASPRPPEEEPSCDVVSSLLVLAAASRDRRARSRGRPPRTLTRAAFDELKHGGFVVVFRHGKTDRAGRERAEDKSPLDLANCADQAMLSEAARSKRARSAGRSGPPASRSGRCWRAATAGRSRWRAWRSGVWRRRMRCCCRISFRSRARRPRRRGGNGSRS